jgi:hypothetical protein
MKRVNEFGFSAEMLEEKTKDGQNKGQPAAIEANVEPKAPTDKKDD